MKAYLILPLLIFSMGCATTVNFDKSAIVPAAELKGKVKKDKNENYEIEISGKHLAKPEDLSPAKSYYVLWMETDKGIINLGNLKIDNSLNAGITAVNSSKPNKIFITAEDDITVQMPGTQTVVISQSLDLK